MRLNVACNHIAVVINRLVHVSRINKEKQRCTYSGPLVYPHLANISAGAVIPVKFRHQNFNM